jgi:hypothetical protein
MRRANALAETHPAQSASQTDRWFIYALAGGLAVVIAAFGAGLSLDSPALSATCTICVALLALFAFIAGSDRSFGHLGDYAKAGAAGVALPLAVVTSTADMSWWGFVAVFILALLVSFVLVLVKTGRWRPPGSPADDSHGPDQAKETEEPEQSPSAPSP